MRFEVADVRYNNGRGALLCNRCSIILEYGFEHEDKLHFCEECEPHKQEWCLDQLAKETQDYDKV